MDKNEWERMDEILMRKDGGRMNEKLWMNNYKKGWMKN